MVHATFGLIFVPLVLRQFVDMIGGNPGTDLNLFWIFGVTAALGFYAGAVKGIRVQLLLGSIALIVSWTALWSKILSDGIGAHYGIYRGLLGILAIGLLAGALYLWRTNPGGDEVASSATAPAGDLGLWKASELLTGAGIAAVIGTGLGITAVGNLNPFATSPITAVGTNTFWDVLLLAVSIGLVGIGSQIGTRGPVYIGAIGLFLFLLIVGLDLNSDQPNPFKFGVWPWILLVFGLGAVAPQLGEGGEPGRPAQAPGREPAREVVDSEELARRFLAALSAGDREAVGELVHPDVEIRTERTVHRGRAAAMEWSEKTFDHLVRRYVPVEIEHTEDGLLVHAELQYVWREDRQVGDSSRVAIELGVRDGLISSWYLVDEPE